MSRAAIRLTAGSSIGASAISRSKTTRSSPNRSSSRRWRTIAAASSLGMVCRSSQERPSRPKRSACGHGGMRCAWRIACTLVAPYAEIRAVPVGQSRHRNPHTGYQRHRKFVRDDPAPHGVCKGCLSNKTALAMIFKLGEVAEKSWRRLNSHNQLPKIILGASLPTEAKLSDRKLKPP